MALIKPGEQLRSRVCTTQVIVVKAPSVEVTIACGDQPMATRAEEVDPPAQPLAANGPGTQLGKRYVHQELGLELLCVKGGPGVITVNGEAIPQQSARPLPASD